MVAADVFLQEGTTAPWEDVPVFLPNQMPKKWLVAALREQLGPPVSPRSASNELNYSDLVENFVNPPVAREPLPLALTLAPCLGLTLAPRLALAEAQA